MYIKRLEIDNFRNYKSLQIDFDEKVNWTLDGEFGGSEKHVLIENNRNKIDLLVPNDKK